MPIKTVTYTCSICSTVFGSLADAEECERQHKIPATVSKPLYDKKHKPEYPDSVLITFTDGKSARYSRRKY